MGTTIIFEHGHSDFDNVEVGLPEDDQSQYSAVFLANTITIAVAVIFVLPDVSSHTHSFNHSLSSNEIYITMFFSGLTLGCVNELAARRVSILLMWSCLAIPLLSILRYNYVRNALLAKSSSALVRDGSSKAKGEKKSGSKLASKLPKDRSAQSATNKSGADLHGPDLMSFFDNVTGEVNSVIMTQSAPGSLFSCAQSFVHDKKRYVVMGKSKDELVHEGKTQGYFFPRRLEARLAKEQGALFYQASPIRPAFRVTNEPRWRRSPPTALPIAEEAAKGLI